ncbi:protein RALF-like 4 [Impatiens glandulifera]|uniref:protein RALF-like 4 n=1 Tax=Impatiens glandulifera TaxID=253017 RepID=UPI001FB09E17|nr:protein RALF-like 4 [Impatiens glandulifera]
MAMNVYATLVMASLALTIAIGVVKVEATTTDLMFNAARWGLTSLSRVGTNDLIKEMMHDNEESIIDIGSATRSEPIEMNIVSGRIRYISYKLMAKDKVPCPFTGQSYYGCDRRTRSHVNPYHRPCIHVTNCARYPK